MPNKDQQPLSVDDYIARHPDTIQEKLRALRDVIRTSAPDTDESISYGMPAYKLHGKPLIYFAAFTKHIGVYPTTGPIRTLHKELAPYVHAKGSIQFPLDAPLPLDLIRTLVITRTKQILAA